MRLKFILLSFCFSILWADPAFREAPELTSITSEPSTIVGAHVNVLTGDFQDFEEDLHVVAPETLNVQRCYCSSSSMWGIFESRWVTNHEVYASFHESDGNPAENYSRSTQEFRLPLGQTYYFEPKAKKSTNQEVKPRKEFLAQGFTNSSQGVISGQTNPNNMLWVVKDKKNFLKFGNGREIQFDESTSIDRLPSGNRYEYRRGEHPRKEVVLYDSKNQIMGGVKYDGPSKGKAFKADPYVNAITPDGRKACYRFSDYEYWIEDDKVSGYLLKSVERADKPSVSYDWESMPYQNGNDRKICQITRPQGRKLACHYYKPGMNVVHDVPLPIDKNHWLVGRVSAILEPIGQSSALIPSYQFHYGRSEDGQEGCTSVYDALGYKTDYSYTRENRLKRITRYDANLKPYSIETLFWGKPGTREQILLKSRIFRDVQTNKTHFCRYYHYDDKGNVIQENLVGNLTGRSQAEVVVDAKGYPVDNGSDRLVKSFQYSNNAYNLLTNEKCGSYERDYAYLANSNRLIACYHKDKGKIFRRHYYAYDATGQIIQQVIDDGCMPESTNLQGVTERRVERIKRTSKYPMGLPEETTELYVDLATGCEKQLKRTMQSFNVLGLVTQKQVFDANNELFSTECWNYDNHGNILTYTNALQETWTYSYDDNDNQISEHGPDGRSFKLFFYDYMNRLISTEYHGIGEVLVEKTSYDLVGNPIATTDIHGNVTDYVYDAFKRPIEVIAPGVEDLEGNLYRPVTQTSYDAMSLPRLLTDPEGNQTHSSYTLYGKVSSVQFPDGSQEKFYYDLEGRLVETISKGGVRSVYTLDVQGRPICKQVYDADSQLIYETQSAYNAFHLIWEKDPLGVVTTYQYDGAGRKVEERAGDRLVSYEYSPQGLLTRTSVASLSCLEDALVDVCVFDALQRPVEIRQENRQGTIMKLERFGYDFDGNRIREERETDAGLSIVTTRFDALGIPRERIDPMGRKGVAEHQYDFLNPHGQRVGQTECIDPLGQTTRLTEDALGRIALSVKLDPQGKEIQRIRFKYNSMGKCLQTESSNPLIDGDSGVQVLRWEYDSLGRVVSQMEGYGTAEQKTISYIYHENGHLAHKIKPDGVKVSYLYDSAGRLKEIVAPDVHYLYNYDAKGQVLSIHDLITQKVTMRQYDAIGNVIEETLANGLTLKTTHSAIGGLKECILPDQSRMAYRYDGGLLRAVERISSEGTLQYEHQYLQYDRSGSLLKSSLIYNLGEQTQTYDLNGSTERIQSPFFTETLERNAVGNVTCRKINENRSTFAYDPLYQLSEETGAFQDHYTYDSRLNRVSKNGAKYRYNALNQLLSDGDTQYEYDPSGNLIAEGENCYKYDALNRMTSCQTPTKTIQYEYDPFDRCIARKEYLKKSLVKEQRFLFLNQEEIGSVDANGVIQELRILGRGLRAEIGASIAIELNGRVYLPQHDDLGNVIALISPAGSVCESYTYNAYGESKIYDAFHQEKDDSVLGNPWRYASKRHDGSFVHFGLRWYLPRIGRWTTTDPAGYEASPNPYCYVQNNPLNQVDAFGLKEDSINLYDRTHDRSSWEYGAPHSYQSERDSKREPGSSIFGYTSVLWRHLMPVPILQDIGCGLMHFLDQGTLSTFRPWRASKTSVDKVGLKEAKRLALVLITGINTTRQEAIDFGKYISVIYGNVSVYVIHNGDHGMVADLIECGCLILDIPVRAVDFTYNVLQKAIASVGGTEGNGMVKVVMFSQGCLTGENALLKLTPKEQGMMHINTYGPASLIPRGILSTQ